MGARLRAILCLLAALAAGPAPAAAEVAIRGRVLAQGGEPAPRVRLTLYPILGRYAEGVLELEGGLDPEPAASALSDARGEFEITAPEIGMWRLVARARGFLPMAILLAPLIEESRLPDLDLVPDLSIRVEAVAPDGRTLAGVRVRATSASPWLWKGIGPSWRPAARRGSTGEDGSLTLPRASGEELDLSAVAAGLLFRDLAGAAGSSARLASAAGRKLSIKVRDHRGEPQPAVLVALAEIAVRSANEAPGRRSLPLGLTDEKGRLELHLPAGRAIEIDLLAADRRFRRERLTPESAAQERLAVFHLPPAVSFSGRVVDASSRRPIGGALAWLWGQPATHVRSGGDGGYVLDSSGEGEQWVRAAAPGYIEGVALGRTAERGPTLALRPAVGIAGVVVDERGGALEGVELRAAPSPEQRRPISLLGSYDTSGGRTRSDAEGRFRIAGLIPGFAYDLTARKPGFAPDRIRIPALEPHAARADLRLELASGGEAHGRVVDRSQRPVAGAEVSLLAAPEPSRPPFFRLEREEEEAVAAVSDARGEFRLAHLPAGLFELRASASGYAPTVRSEVRLEASGAPLDLGDILLEPGAAVEGRVGDPEGRPLAGVAVRVAAAGDASAPYYLTRTDLKPPDAVSAADGGFEVGGLRAGERVDLHLSRKGWASSTVPGVEAGTGQPVRIELQPASRVSGRVVDERGDPIAGARVVVVSTGRGPGRVYFSRSRARSGSADADGRFEIEDVEPGEADLSASAEERQPASLPDLVVPVGRDLEGLEIVLASGAVVEGRVLRSDGAPVIGALVEISQASGRPGRIVSLDALTDGDGRFGMEGVPLGPQTLEAIDDSYRRARKDIEVGPGLNRAEIRFEGGVEVSGRVVDEAGAAVDGARVNLYSAGGWALATSRADGSFEFEGVDDGTYTLYARRAGFAEQKMEKEVRVAGAPVSGLEVRLGRGGTIAGNLRGLEPVDLARVRIEARRDRGRAEGLVTEEGAYRIPHLSAGEWRVSAEIPGGGRRAQGVALLEPGVFETFLDLEFGGGLTLTGRVLLGSRPMVGAWVAVEGFDVDAEGSSAAGPEGRFRIDDLREGNYRLSVVDLQSGFRHLEEVSLSGDRDILIAPETGSLAGQVLDSSDASPLFGVELSLQPAAGTEGLVEPHAAGTDSQGRFRFDNVVQGAYRLVARKEGYATAELAAVVEPGSPGRDLEVRLGPTRGLVLEVVTAAGSSPEFIWAAAADGAGRVVDGGFVEATESGRFRLATLPEGSWEVHVTTQGAGLVTLPAQVPGPPLRAVLPPACRLEISVPELADQPLLGTATLLDPEGRPYRFPASADRLQSEWRFGGGKLTFRSLRPGTWTVRVGSPDGRSWSGRATVSPGGVTELVLD